jgi:hypothetical protein
MVAASANIVPNPDLPLRLLAAPILSGDRKTRVLVVLEVRVPRAKAVAGTLSDDVAVTVLAADISKAKVVRQVKLDRHVAVPVPTGSISEELSYQITTTVDLPPASYQLRVSARSKTAGKTGSVYVGADLRSYAKAGLALGGIIVGYAGPGPIAPSADRGHTLLPFEPILDRTFTFPVRLRILCALWGRDRSKTLVLQAELVDSAQRVARTMPVPSSPAGTAVAPDSLDTTVELDGLAAGPYLIRVTATNGTHTAVREVGVIVASK